MADAKISLNGVEYVVPKVVEFDLDEAEILWNYAGLTIADVVLDSTKIFRPQALRAMMHVAIRRRDGEKKVEEALKGIGGLKVMTFMDEFARLIREAEEDEDENPPDEARSGHEKKPASSKNGSGNDSTNGSDGQASVHVLTGTQPSDISVTSGRETLGG